MKGERIEIGLNAIAQRDDTGRAVSYQGVAHDITEAVRQKELEAIGQLAGCFADDLAPPPLSVIMMGVETFKAFLRTIDRPTETRSCRDAGRGGEESMKEMESQVSDVHCFLGEVATADEDVRRRLNEIRDQYWNWKKVSDGSGGIIYQRASKGR